VLAPADQGIERHDRLRREPGIQRERVPAFDIPSSTSTSGRVIVTHAHMDHCVSSLPLQMGYTARLHDATHSQPPTMLQLDYVDIADKEGKDPIYSKKTSRRRSVGHPLEYNEVTTSRQTSSSRSTTRPHPRLGMAHLHIATATTTWSTRRLQVPAHQAARARVVQFPARTIGSSHVRRPALRHAVRHESERHLVNLIIDVINRKGKILIPCSRSAARRRS